MIPATYDLTIPQGTDYQLPLAFKQPNRQAMDLTGYAGQAQIRRDYDSLGIIATFNVAFATDRTTGLVTLSLTNIQTSALSPDYNYVWDFIMTDSNGAITRMIQGEVRITAQVTGLVSEPVNIDYQMLPIYPNNEAAVAGNLLPGAFYRTGGDPDLVCVVH
jgi:hypothetical protein